MRPSSVDLPLPEGPAMARNWPAGTSRETSVSTSTPAPAALEAHAEPADADHDGIHTTLATCARSSGCSSCSSSSRRVAPAPAPAQAPDRVIVAFGDSLTSGLGVPADQTYPALLGERLRREGYAYRVVNAGVVGRHHRGRAPARGLGAAAQARDRDPGAGRQRRPPRPEPGLGARQPGSARGALPGRGRPRARGGHAPAPELRRPLRRRLLPALQRGGARAQRAVSARSSSTASARSRA